MRLYASSRSCVSVRTCSFQISIISRLRVASCMSFWYWDSTGDDSTIPRSLPVEAGAAVAKGWKSRLNVSRVAVFFIEFSFRLRLGPVFVNKVRDDRKKNNVHDAENAECR